MARLQKASIPDVRSHAHPDGNSAAACINSDRREERRVKLKSPGGKLPYNIPKDRGATFRIFFQLTIWIFVFAGAGERQSGSAGDTCSVAETCPRTVVLRVLQLQPFYETAALPRVSCTNNKAEQNPFWVAAAAVVLFCCFCCFLHLPVSQPFCALNVLFGPLVRGEGRQTPVAISLDQSASQRREC